MESMKFLYSLRYHLSVKRSLGTSKFKSSAYFGAQPAFYSARSIQRCAGEGKKRTERNKRRHPKCRRDKDLFIFLNHNILRKRNTKIVQLELYLHLPMAASISRMSAHPGNKGPQWSSFPSDWRCCNSDFHPDFFLFFSFFFKDNTC